MKGNIKMFTSLKDISEKIPVGSHIIINNKEYIVFGYLQYSSEPYNWLPAVWIDTNTFRALVEIDFNEYVLKN